MTVWVFDDNLLWSERLARSLRSMGHEPRSVVQIPEGDSPGAAFINLSCRAFDASELVPKLKAMGIRTIGFAGHKESALLEAGRGVGCDRIATNSEVTFRLANVIEPAIEHRQ